MRNEKKMRDAFNLLVSQGHLMSYHDFCAGYECAEAALKDAVGGDEVRYTSDGALAECPCCGSLDVGGAHDTVHCYKCGLSMKHPPPLQNAADAWNRRSHPQASAAVPEGYVQGQRGRGVLTYQNQPFDNVIAWRLGEACLNAKPGGDFIDGGLSLLKELQAKGFGVVPLAASQPEVKSCGNCHKCLKGVTENGWPVTSQRMILCGTCANKRCPKASDHNLECTGSNEPGQPGSVYGQHEVTP